MKTLKALLVNGSPRAKGCTFTALTELKKTLDKGYEYYESFKKAVRRRSKRGYAEIERAE